MASYTLLSTSVVLHSHFVFFPQSRKPSYPYRISTTGRR